MKKEWYEKEWYENDMPRDLSQYRGMSENELDAEIAKLEAEARAERARLEREEALVSA